MAFINKICFRKRSKFHRRILGFLVIFGLSGIVIQGNVGGVEETYAQTTTVQGDTINTASTSSTDQMGLIDIFDLILKVIYVLLWPLLVIAGWALDNTLVYGSFFHMDAPLWKFWNMMKNFANFALGFIVLFSILKNLFPGKEDKETSPFSIIKKTLIAGVLIQASWFLMAALIDVSTVATYAVGGLPLTIMQNTDLGSKKILAVHSELDMSKFKNITAQDNGDYFKVRYETANKDGKQILLSDCKTQSGYVIGRRDGDVKFRNAGVFSSISGSTLNACVLMGSQVYLFNEFTNPNPDLFGDNNASNADYQNYLNSTLEPGAFQPDWKGFEACGFIVRINGQSEGLGTCATSITDYNISCINAYSSSYNSTEPCLTAPPDQDLNKLGLSGGTNRFQNNTNAITLSSLIDKSKGFVGPLVTMYSSMLNFAQMSDVQPNSAGRVTGEILIKAAFAIMLFFPLIALAVVLIIRIGYLWMIIVASPFLILKESFKGSLKRLGKIGEDLNLASIVSLAFAPVITVFALSISLIFMTTLIKSYSPSNDGTTISSAFSSKNDGLEQIKPTNGGDQAYRVAGITDIEFQNLTRGGTLDRFSWLIVNFVAVGFVWVLLFAAINASKLTAKATKPIQSFGQNFFTTLPIVPLPGGGRVGIAPAIKEAWEVPQTAIQTKINTQQLEAASRFSGTKPEEGIINTTTATITATQAEEIVKGGTGTTGKLTTPEIYTNTSNVPLISTAIDKFYKDNSTKHDAEVKDAATYFGKEFEKQVKEGSIYTSATDIADRLNIDNNIIRKYAESKGDRTITTTTKPAKTYTIKYGAEGKTTVTETTPGTKPETDKK